MVLRNSNKPGNEWREGEVLVVKRQKGKSVMDARKLVGWGVSGKCASLGWKRKINACLRCL